jgi:hypothetical protein
MRRFGDTKYSFHATNVTALLVVIAAETPILQP